MALSESSADGSPLLRARARLAGPSFGRARRGASLARQHGRRALLRGAAVGLLFAVWELAPRLGLVERTFLPPLSEVLSAGAALARSGQLWQHLRASGVRAIAGLALALLYAVPLGLAIGWYRALAELLGPLIEVLRNTAALALLPVFILLLGIGETSKIALVTYACSWPILLSTVSAVRQVDPLLIRCARTLALSPPRLFARVILPAALPTIFAGIRLAAGNAVLVLIAAEMIGAKAGLGFLVINSQYSFQIPQMYVGILAITAVGLALNHVLLRVEARLSAWRPVETRAAEREGSDEEHGVAYPSVYPTGVTVYDPERCWSGYTLLQAAELGALLIDMNGGEQQLWRGLQGFPNKLLPGGFALGSTARRDPRHGFQDQVDLVQVDWSGRIVWRFSELEYIADPGQTPRWMARQHHDHQREGSPVGYYAPGQEPRADGGRSWLLVHENARDDKIAEHPLLDDKIVEIDWNGRIQWEWRAREHFEELGFDDAAKSVLHRDPNLRPEAGGSGDWLHLNSLSLLGPNRWHAAGDERFHPENLIWSSREANLIAIVSRRTGQLVWKLGPRYDESDALRRLGWIIGPHHPHLIPESLPGGGNLLVFDNGGWAGYGAPHPSAPSGRLHALRDHSRVLEIDPVTLEIVWQYTPREAGFVQPLDAARFYSPFISSAQRLPNGNTLITEGSDGRIFEVTPEHRLVWEYLSPYWGSGRLALNLVYRAYRVPYEWVPQLSRPAETPVERLDVRRFRVPGAAPLGRLRETPVAGVDPQQPDAAFCVVAAPAR